MEMHFRQMWMRDSGTLAHLVLVFMLLIAHQHAYQAFPRHMLGLTTEFFEDNPDLW